MRDLDIQHPDITAAELTGYPWRPRRKLEYSPELLREFTKEMEWAFLDFCRYKEELVEEFVQEQYQDFQDWLEEREAY